MRSDLITRIRSAGPAALVAAAFIGPGTVATCSVAGAGFGYSLLWALLFSTIATILLQEMSSRLGLIGQTGLGEALRHEFSLPATRMITAVLVLSGIAVGNAAYETGNILGGVMGLGIVTGISNISILGHQLNLWGPVIGLSAFIILFIGRYRLIEKGLVALVIIMSLTFITTAIITRPDLRSIASGLFIPSMPHGSALTIVGLIGTTVVPYNLFLHASAVKEKWKGENMLKTVRTDNFISIGIGGLISMSIVITSAAAFFGTSITIKGAGDLAVQLKPLLGGASEYFLAIGLLSAGISSAITAPLAAAYATSGIMGWSRNLRDRKFRMVWLVILLTGTIFSTIGLNPVRAILFAQVANGILLPVIAVFLLRVMNNRKLLGDYANGRIANIAGFLVVLVTVILGLKSILAALKII